MIPMVGLWKWRLIVLNNLEQNLRHGHWQSLEVDLASLVTGALFLPDGY